MLSLQSHEAAAVQKVHVEGSRQACYSAGAARLLEGAYT
jgi:hypothetical protein